MRVDWRVAPALETLRHQLNTLCPGRSVASDGAIGDAAHASRASDHNPHLVLDGVRWVTARDFTHDPSSGLDGTRLANTLQQCRDPRVKYVIWSNRIMSGDGGPKPWQWRPYSGPNPHTKHVHLSVVAGRGALSPLRWDLVDLLAPPATPWPTIRRGSNGSAVKVWQRFLGLTADGQFGPRTEAATKEYQRMRGMTGSAVDGIVGPATWAESGL